MLKVDAFPHILPRKLYERMFDHASGEVASMKKRVAGIPVLWDLDARFRVMDRKPRALADGARIASERLWGAVPARV